KQAAAPTATARRGGGTCNVAVFGRRQCAQRSVSRAWPNPGGQPALQGAVRSLAKTFGNTELFRPMARRQCAPDDPCGTAQQAAHPANFLSLDLQTTPDRQGMLLSPSFGVLAPCFGGSFESSGHTPWSQSISPGPRSGGKGVDSCARCGGCGCDRVFSGSP